MQLIFVTYLYCIEQEHNMCDFYSDAASSQHFHPLTKSLTHRSVKPSCKTCSLTHRSVKPSCTTCSLTHHSVKPSCMTCSLTHRSVKPSCRTYFPWGEMGPLGGDGHDVGHTEALDLQVLQHRDNSQQPRH